jgi:anaerobic carbon-monoxide dehydrogenase iron sulfur subunit
MPHVKIATKTCTGCHMCELACSAWHEGAYRPSLARLFVDVDARAGTVKGRTCLQTSCARCQKACPNEAIVTRELTLRVKGDFSAQEKLGAELRGYVLVVDEELCTGCGECYAECPTATIHEHPERGVAFKCDLCGGEPQCIAFCQNPHVLAVDLRVDRRDRELEGA